MRDDAILVDLALEEARRHASVSSPKFAWLVYLSMLDFQLGRYFR